MCTSKRCFHYEHTRVLRAQRSQKRMSDPAEVQLQTVVAPNSGLGLSTQEALGLIPSTVNNSEDIMFILRFHSNFGF